MDSYSDAFDGLFQHSLSGLALNRIVCDAAGTPVDYVLERINPAFERLTGLQANEVLGKRATEVVPGLAEANLVALFGQVVQTGEPLQMQHYSSDLRRYYNLAAFRISPGRFAFSCEDITDRKEAEDILIRTAQQISSEVGGEFLRRLVLSLAKLLDADFALVGEYLHVASGRIRCHALYANGTVEEGFEYDLAGSPCDSVLSGDACVYPSHIQQLFPRDALLAEMGAEAYVGAPLVDSSGGRLGIIAVLWKTPLRNVMRAGSAVKLFASRAASELERKRSEEALIRHTEQLEQARREQEETARNLQRMLDVVADARAKAERANQFKSDFLATVSHEIRTPLNAILGVTELLENSPLAPQQSDDAATIRDAANVLLQLINDLLDFSKIESGFLAMESIPLSLPEALRRALGMIAAQAERKHLELRCELSRELPEWITGDPARINQILLNLLSNAVKFTAGGHVTLRCRPASLRPLRIRVEVQDSGIGIPEQVQAHLFEPFVQADASFTRRYGGTGLGLAISRRLVQAMHGEIGIQSVPGEGSTFWFEIPAQTAPAPAKSTAPVAVPPGPSSLDGCRILVVEDNIVNQRVAVRLLERLGCQADVASNGLEAIRMWETFRYDAILMDCQMPEMDGLQATRQIRAAESPSRRTPIIALTANAMAGERETCLQAGMDDYLSKPISLDALGSVLGVWSCLRNPMPAVSRR